MSDPIERLSGFGTEFEGGAMPLPAEAVRRRGDRIRRRRNALVAGGAAIAAAAVAVPVLAVAQGGPQSGDRDQVAGQTRDAAPAALSTATLLTDDDTVYTPGYADWFTTGTLEGEGAEAFNPCALHRLSSTGATGVVRADYELRNLEPGAPEVRGDSLVQVVVQYDDEEAAATAANTVRGWLDECAARPAELTEYRALQTRKVAVPGGEGTITDSHLGPVARDLDPYGDAAYIMETGVARVGDRLTVLTSVVVGQDYDFPEGTPVERMLPKAADRMAR